MLQCCAHWPSKLYYYYYTDLTWTDTYICSSVKSTRNWQIYCDLAFSILAFFSSWQMLCQKYLAPSPLHRVPLDTDSCLNYKGSNVSNEPTEISSYIERLWVTLSSPPDPNPSLRASPNELFIYYSEIRMRRVADTEVLWRIALHANVVLQSLSPTNQQFCSKLICIQYSLIQLRCTAWKYKFHSSHVWSSWNCLELCFNSS